MTLRTEKVSSLIKQELSQYILREQYEGVHGLLTITGVDVSADLGQAVVSVAVVGQDEDEALQVLNDHIYEMQGHLNRKLVLKQVPRIKFVIDKAGEYAEHINDLLKHLKDEE